jgi:DNA repair protein RadA/Sms
MAKSKTVYVCQNCGAVSPRWQGQCPSCGEWNTFAEEVQSSEARARAARVPAMGTRGGGRAPIRTPQRLDEIELTEESRLMTGVGELDRVLGGGIMRGSLILLAGDPGIGKSTLMTSLGRYLAGRKVLYVTGEESLRQVKLRAERLGVPPDGMLLLAETDVEEIAAASHAERPDLLVVDSIQTVFRPDIESAPGSVSQVRESTASLLHLTKSLEHPKFLVGHVTKSGNVAGPRVLEHMVDTVLQFEGDRHHAFRILRAVKNRFGSTSEMGVFEMHSDGLHEVANPSEIFLSERSYGISGSAVTCTLEGTRPVLVEVQALVTPTSYPSPQRTAAGFDGKRLSLLLAVLEKRHGMRLSTQDVFLNVAGGIRVDEPAVDLGVLAAVASSLDDVPTDSQTICIGEVGLGGELRSVGQIERRLQEAARLGFTQAVVPHSGWRKAEAPKGLRAHPVKTLSEALKVLIG